MVILLSCLALCYKLSLSPCEKLLKTLAFTSFPREFSLTTLETLVQTLVER